MPKFVEKDDWDWLVEFFGSSKFQKKNQRNIKNRSYLDAGHTAGKKSFAQKVEDMYERDKVMPGLLDVYEETHTKKDKTPVTELANDTLTEIKKLVEERNAGEISLTDEEVYAKVQPNSKRGGRDRHSGISPAIASLFGSFTESEKLRKEAEKMKIEAANAKEEAIEAKKEAIEANEKNAILTKELEGVKKENKVARHYLEKLLNTMGYNLSELNMDEDLDESNDEDEEDGQDEEEE